MHDLKTDPVLPKDRLAPPPARVVGGRPTRVLFVGHDATRTGAPMSLLRVTRWLREHSDLEFRYLMRDGGPMLADYQAVAPVRVVRRGAPAGLGWTRRFRAADRAWRKVWRRRLKSEVRSFAPDVVYLNSTAVAEAAWVASSSGAPVIQRVPELEVYIRERIGLPEFAALKSLASHYVAVSEAVKENLEVNHGIAAGSIDVIHGFLPPTAPRAGDPGERRRRVCEEFGLDPSWLFVGGAGTLDWRKGPDLFLRAAMSAVGRDPSRPLAFLWLGGDAPASLQYEIDRAGLGDRFRLLGLKSNALDYIDLFDVFAMTSREDPYPLVMLEAASLGKPIVCFDRSGGAPEFVEDDCGFVVPYQDTAAMADRVLELLDSAPLRARMGEASRTKAERRHDLGSAGARVLELIERVSRRPS